MNAYNLRDRFLTEIDFLSTISWSATRCARAQVSCARVQGYLSKFLSATLVVFFALCHPAMSATVGFKPAVTYPVGKAPVAVAVGDFNGDGKPDLAVANSGDPTANDDGSISILLGNGDGTFQAAMNVAAGKNPVSIAVGDFNGDGRLDLAVINGDAGVGKVGILLGNGDGTLQPPVDYATGSGPKMVVVGDFNADHKLDLVVANATGGSVSVLLGNGDGTFQSHVDYITGGSTHGVAVADFNGDGKADLAVDSGQGVTVLIGNGDGTFQQVWTSTPLLIFVVSVTVGDFNADGRPDLIVDGANFGNATASSVIVLLGNGDGTFSPTPFGTPACHNSSPLVADFDGDSKLDLAVFSDDNCLPSPKVNPRILVFGGDGDGTFKAPVSSSASQNELLIEAVDLDGNGSPDVVAIDSSAPDTISVLLNTLAIDFSVSASVFSPSTISPGQSVSSTVTLSLLNAFDHAVSLACSVQPAQAGSPTCSLNSTSVRFDASGKASAQLTISAGAASASLSNRSSRQRSEPWNLAWLPVAGLAFAGAGLGRIKQGPRRGLGFFVACTLFAGLILLAGCGGGSSSVGPKSQTYTVMVTGTSGATQHSTTVTLAVQ